MALPKPGDYITAKCGRCNDITGHVVMLILDGVINKVECKACGSVHKYRESRLAKPGRAKEDGIRHVRAGQSREAAKVLGTPKAARTPAASSKPPAGKRSSAKLESAWQEAMVRHSAETPLPYTMNGTYAPQDFLDHPVFGRGEVLSVNPPDKMDVLFQEGVKTLRCKT